MTSLRPVHWYNSRDDLIWPVGPFKCSRKIVTQMFLLIQVSLSDLNHELGKAKVRKLNTFFLLILIFFSSCRHLRQFSTSVSEPGKTLDENENNRLLRH